MKVKKQNPRRIVITGATRGLGRALLAPFSQAGMRIAGCGRSEAGISALRQVYPLPHHFSVVDVSDETSVEKWAETVLAEFGVPDLLINNAALINEPASLWEVPTEEFSRIVDVNIKGIHLVLRAFLPAMISHGTGLVVNLSSGWGRSTSPEVAPYCTTKWAVEGLTQALAQELPDGLAAIPLNPGVIDTDMLRTCFGTGAGGYPDAEHWARKAAPFILGLGPESNGKSLTVG